MARRPKLLSLAPFQRGSSSTRRDGAPQQSRLPDIPSASRTRDASGRLRWPWLLSDRGILTVALLVAGIGVTGLVTMLLIATGATGNDRASLEIDAIKYGLGFFAAGGAAAALLLGVRRQRLSEYAHTLELRKQDHAEIDAAERRVTDLYTKAVEQLGAADAAVRLGGLYALERVAQGNPTQRQTIVHVLCAYLRMPYTSPPETSVSESADAINTGAGGGRDARQELQVRLTAQQILVDHLRLPNGAATSNVETGQQRPFWPDIDLDLTGATLIDWSFRGCVVRDASFTNATFAGSARFDHATFAGSARFDHATFAGSAWFDHATFAGVAGFNHATFSDVAGFDHATFSDVVWLNYATFAGHAGFNHATFGSARFDHATFADVARFNHATFADVAGFNHATFAGHARFHHATFAGGAGFDQAGFSGGVSFDDCVVLQRHDRLDVWPEGWSLVASHKGGRLTITKS